MTVAAATAEWVCTRCGSTNRKLVPADSDHDGRFDRVRLLADPYVAGPYVEGDYEIDFAVEPRWIAAIKPGWRGEFEAQPQ